MPSTLSQVEIELMPLGTQHAENMLRWMSDEFIAKNVGLRNTPSAERTAEWINNALLSKYVMPFAIYCQGRHVGNVILDEIDEVRKLARLSIYIGDREDRGLGVGTEAIREVLRHGRNQGLKKVWLLVHKRNTQARRAYEKAGFKRTEEVITSAGVVSYVMEIQLAASR